MDKIAVLGEVSRCPHCSIATPLLGQVWAGVTPSQHGGSRGWAAFVCSTCGGLVTAAGSPGYNLDTQRPYAIFPECRSANDLLPERARRYLQQAFDTLYAPDAAAVMAGSAVDAMLKELGYEKGSLYDRIDKALEDRVLTQGMADWAHSVRLGSNRPRHADKDGPHVSTQDAERSVNFAEALGNFLFVLSAQIAEAVEQVAQSPGERA